MIKTLITGCNGQLGSEIKNLSSNYTNYELTYTDFDDLDITNFNSVRQFIIKNKFSLIINCAAYTSVDKAEDEYDLSKNINHLAVKNLATIAKEFNIKLIHISTDYVFDGTNFKPYCENDKPNPKSVYGKTKLDGENEIIKINPLNSIIIRTSWVYSFFGKNFLKTMIALSEYKNSIQVVSDQVGSPTYAHDLANAILKIACNIKNKNVEIFNYSNLGVCSWYDFAKSIFEIRNETIQILPIKAESFVTKAERPHYSVLDKNKIINKYNLIIPHWRDSLKKCIKKTK